MAATLDDTIVLDSDDDEVQITGQFLPQSSVSQNNTRTEVVTISDAPSAAISVMDDGSDNDDDSVVQVLCGRTFIDTTEVVDLMFKKLDDAMEAVKQILVEREPAPAAKFLELNGEPVSRTSVRLLLNHFGWEIEPLVARLKTVSLDQVFNECKVLNPQAYYLQLLSSDQGNQTNGTGKERCGIRAYCDDEIETEELFYVKPCNHTFCFDCLSQHVVTTINDNQALVDSLPCPYPNCKVVLEDEVVLGLLCNESSDESLSKYHRVIGTKFVEHNKYLTLCPTPGCSKVAQLFNNPDREAIECPDCLALFCFMCGGNWHEPLTCDQVKQFNSFDDKSLTWISQNTKKCPNCKWPIQKNEGCDHMTCRRCRHQFCWNCFMPMNNGSHFHRTPQEIAACVKQAAEAQQKVNQVHADQVEKFKKIAKSIKVLKTLYPAEQKLRKDFLDNIMTLVRIPKSLTMAKLRSSVRELGLARLLIMTIEIFSVYYEANNEFNRINQERVNLENHLGMYARRMKLVVDGTDGSMTIFDTCNVIESERKSLSQLLTDGINHNKFVPVEKEVNVPPVPIPAQALALNAFQARFAVGRGGVPAFQGGVRANRMYQEMVMDARAQVANNGIRFPAPQMPVGFIGGANAPYPMGLGGYRAMLQVRREQGRERALVRDQAARAIHEIGGNPYQMNRGQMDEMHRVGIVNRLQPQVRDVVNQFIPRFMAPPQIPAVQGNPPNHGFNIARFQAPVAVANQGFNMVPVVNFPINQYGAANAALQGRQTVIHPPIAHVNGPQTVADRRTENAIRRRLNLMARMGAPQPQ